jgi:hypothetical protein
LSHDRGAVIAKKDLLPDFGHPQRADRGEPDASPAVADVRLRTRPRVDRGEPGGADSRPREETARERVLSNDELRELWTALVSLADQAKQESAEAVQELRRSKAWVSEATRRRSRCSC